jgi:Ca-activated chloride channel family protein
MKRMISIAACAAGAALILSGCTPSPKDSSNAFSDGPNVLRVMAGSEVKDMQPILDDLKRETGVDVKFQYAGTLEGTELLAKGDLKGKYDATWFPSNRYLNLLDGGNGSISHEEKIMHSPVVLGVKSNVASKLGWDKKTPTWQEILQAVEAGNLKYGMTSPVSSNSGFSTLISAATALSQTGDALTEENVKSVTPSLKKFFAGQTLTSGSSGWLAEKFASAPEQDAIFNYKSTLDSVTVEGKPLTIVTPSDGVVTADYPLSFISGGSAEKDALYKKATDYLLRDEVQKKISEVTKRTTKATTPEAGVPTAFELPFPNRISTVQSLITAYLEDIKKPSNVVFDIDTSGSMDGERIVNLKNALSTMTNTAGGASSFIAFQPRETISYVEFSDVIKHNQTFQVTDADRAANLQEINSYISKLTVGGGTAVYDSLEVSYQNALREKKANPESFTSIVLFTDGESNRGKNYSEFVNLYNSLVATNPEVKEIPVYTVMFGEGDRDEMKNLGDLTGGKSFDAKNSSLTEIFKEIRGYQ